MSAQQAGGWSRREFLGGLALTGAVGLFGLHPRLGAAEPPPETTRLRLVRENSICLAPQYVAEELLKAEGFTSVEYVALEGGLGNPQLLASGKADLTADAVPAWLPILDKTDTVVILAGVHVGCYELFGTDRVRTVRDLKGKTVAVTELRDDRHAFVASMAMQVGLDPRKDVTWVTHPADEAMRLLAAEQIDAFLGFPPEPQELRARKIGHVLVDIRTHKPWSQYFCCMLAANREFARRHPVATKRAVRAVIKANDLCATEPERVARFLVDKGYTPRLEYALQTLKEIPYAQWREYSAEDSLRFYALRLQETGFIESSPKKILAERSDWRFLNELRKELKG
jgi:NitT/TauT family transport system substrate-binding protein